jgi:hypothetical protein
MDTKRNLAKEQIPDSEQYVTISLIVGVFLMVIITIVLLVSWFETSLK